MPYRIDINCDMGESFGVYKLGWDEEVMGFISSANIACGWHGGDPVVMEKTVRLAREKGVGVGAHPSYPDLMGFGRRHMDLTKSEMEAYLLYQMGALYAFTKAQGLPLQHVKAHGAMANLAFIDLEASKAIARAAARLDEKIIFVALAGSVMVQAAKEVGVRYVEEVYADRVYNPDGTLQSRKIIGSVIHDPTKATAQALAIVKEGQIIAHDGTTIKVNPETLCIHGDTSSAIEILRKIREEFRKADIVVKPMGQ